VKCTQHRLERAFCRVKEHSRCGYPIMKRIAAFSLATWTAAAILYFGQHSVAMIALSGVVVLGGFDMLRP
jgi:hypothetical protein